MSTASKRQPQQINVDTAEDTMAVSPPLKWAGGKRWQLPHLRPLWEPQQHRRLVEPFCGGLAVSLGLRPERAMVNDVNAHLVNFYRWLKKGLRLRRAFENEEANYYKQRERFNALLERGKSDTREAAVLFYYLNRTGYNGLCRFNQSGGFNVPFGRHKTINYRSDFSEYIETFAEWTFECGDFEDLKLNGEDFIYADPPYDVPFTQYSKGGFGWDEQVRAAEWLTQHPGPVVLVNQATDRIVELYLRFGFELQELNAPRRISCTGDREPAKEVLAVRNMG